MHSHDAAFAGLGWEIWGLRETSVLVLQTNKAKTGVLLRVFYSVGGGRSHGHAEALGERGYLLITITVEILLRIVDSHATVDAVGQSTVLHNGYPFVGAVRMLKEHGCSPVVAEVFGECACSAGSYGRWIFLHSRVECIASNDLVNVSGRKFAWLNERIKPLNAQCRASEA